MSLSKISQRYAQPYREGKAGFPADDLTPEQKKTPAWTKQVAEAILGSFATGSAHLPFGGGNGMAVGTNRSDYAMNRRYAQGTQPISKYVDFLYGPRKRGEDADDRRRARHRGSWDIDSPAPRYVETIRSVLEGIDHTPQIRAVDPHSRQDREREKYALWEATHNKWLLDRYMQMGLRFQPVEFEPHSEEEADLYLEHVFEFQHERALGILVNDVLIRSGLRGADVSLRDDTHDNHVELGIAIWRREIEYDKGVPIIRFRSVDPESCIHPASQHKDYRDVPWTAEYRIMRPGEIRQRWEAVTGKAWGKEQEKQLVDSIRMTHQDHTALPRPGVDEALNYQRDSHGALPWDHLGVAVLDFAYRSYDKRVYSLKEKDGRANIDLKKPNYRPSSPDRKVVVAGMNRWYHGSWVIGTDLTLSAGQLEWDIDANPFIIYRLTNKPMISQMIPTLDDMQMVILKARNAWARARGRTLKVNWNALLGMTLDSKKLTPFDVLDLAVDRGTLVTNEPLVRTKSRNATEAYGEIEGGVGSLLNEASQAMMDATQRLNYITGVNETLLGGQSPKSHQAVGTTEIALSGSQNRIRSIYTAYLNMLRRACIVTVQTIKAMVKHYGKSAFPYISEAGLRALEIGEDVYDRIYEVNVQIVPTAEMRAQLTQDLADAVARGVLGPDERVELMAHLENGEFDFARRLLSHRVRVRERRAAEAAQRQQENNLQSIQAQAQAQTQSQVTVNKEKSADEINLEGARAEYEARLKRLEADLESMKRQQQSEKTA